MDWAASDVMANITNGNVGAHVLEEEALWLIYEDEYSEAVETLEAAREWRYSMLQRHDPGQGHERAIRRLDRLIEDARSRIVNGGTNVPNPCRSRGPRGSTDPSAGSSTDFERQEESKELQLPSKMRPAITVDHIDHAMLNGLGHLVSSQSFDNMVADAWLGAGVGAGGGAGGGALIGAVAFIGVEQLLTLPLLFFPGPGWAAKAGIDAVAMAEAGAMGGLVGGALGAAGGAGIGATAGAGIGIIRDLTRDDTPAHRRRLATHMNSILVHVLNLIENFSGANHAPQLSEAEWDDMVEYLVETSGYSRAEIITLLQILKDTFSIIMEDGFYLFNWPYSR